MTEPLQPTADNPAEPGARQCPSCGAQVSPQAEFCGVCGKPIPSTTVERVQVSLLYVELVTDESVDTERLQADKQVLLGEIARLAGAKGGRTEGVVGDVIEIVFTVPFARMPPRDALHVAEELRRVLNERFDQHDWRMAIATGIGAREGEVLVSGAFARARSLIETAGVASIEMDDETRSFKLVEPTRAADSLLGRERERASIEGALLASVAEKRCYRMLLLAEPGIGKSRLAEECLARMSAGAGTAATRCQPWGEGSLSPLEQVMRQLLPGLKEDPEQATRELLADQEDREVIVAQVCRLFGWGDAPDVPDVSVWSVRRLLEELSVRQPLVLLFDDLHWADEPLLDALEDLTTRLAGRVLLLCAARPDLLRRRADFSLEGSYTHVRKLKPLDREGSIELIEGVLGGPVEQGAWIDSLLSAAQGSPLFLVEALSLMRDGDQLIVKGGLWQAAHEVEELAMSPTIEALIGTRVASLPHSEREAIEAASVWGIDFEVDQLQALIPGSQPTELLGRFARLQSSAFVEAAAEVAGSPTFRIRHGLIRDAAYEACTKARRGDLHERAAAYGEERALADAFVGYHLEQTFKIRRELSPRDPRNPPIALKAATALAAAGRNERARGAPGSAIEFYERALALRLERDAGWIDDSIEMAECHLNLGRVEDAGRISDEVDRAAQELADPVATGRSELLRATIDTVLGSTEPAVEQTFIRLLPQFQEQNDNTTLVKLYQGISEWHWNRLEVGAAGDAMGEALECCLRTTQKLDLGYLVSGLAAVAYRGPTSVPLGVIVCERLLTITSGDPFSRAQVNMRLGVIEALGGGFKVARDRARESRGILVELGQDRAAAVVTQEAGMIELLSGDLRSARTEFKRGFDELGELGLKAYQASNAALLGRTLYELRQVDEALEYISRAEEEVEDDPSIGLETFPIKAQIAADHGDRDGAIALIAAAREEVYRSDALVAQAQVEIQAVRVFRKLALADETRDAFDKARSLCEQKEAPALLALIEGP